VGFGQIHHLDYEIEILGGRIGDFRVMMSRSRRIGAWPSIRRRERWSAFVMTHSPMMMRSPTFLVQL
jgi:hypothetical protein